MGIWKYLFTSDKNKITPWNELLGSLKKEKEKYEEYCEQKREKAKTYVLTISDISYVKKVGKRLDDYHNELIEGNSLEDMVVKGEEIGAEVIIATQISKYISTIFWEEKYYLGTALIPKKKDK